MTDNRPISRKGLPPPIDLIKLHVGWTSADWNSYLKRCFDKRDMRELEKTLVSLQLGMDRLAKLKLNSPQMCSWFVRLCRSIEKTMVQIVRAHNPHPLDDPLNAKDFASDIESKRKRDREFAEHLKRTRF